MRVRIVLRGESEQDYQKSHLEMTPNWVRVFNVEGETYYNRDQVIKVVVWKNDNRVK